MKKIMTAVALAAATLGMHSAALAEVEILPPDETSDARTIMLEVEKMPSVVLSGSLFEQPIMPTLEELESGQPTTLGEMRITSSAGMCYVSMTTDNDFALMDQNSGVMLTKYMLDYQNPMMPLYFDSNAQGPMSVDCLTPVSGMMTLMPMGYDPGAPAGMYTDVVNVLVEVAG